MISRPTGIDLTVEAARSLFDLVPGLFAGLEEERGVEVDAAFYFGAGERSVLEADLGGF